MTISVESYLLGVPVIDEEHIKLFYLSNRLEAILNGTSLLSSFDIAAELYEYVWTHLKHEEELIKGWEGYASHVMQHRALTYQLDNLFEQISRPLFIDASTCILEELRTLVVDWLTKHILVDDAQFIPWLKSHSTQTSEHQNAFLLVADNR
jgi:hemerythrin